MGTLVTKRETKRDEHNATGAIPARSKRRGKRPPVARFRGPMKRSWRAIDFTEETLHHASKSPVKKCEKNAFPERGLNATRIHVHFAGSPAALRECAPGMRLRIFDARRARSEHARGLGPDDDPSPRARFPGGARRGDPFSTVHQPFDEAHLGEARDVAARRGRRARAAPRCAAREKAPTCGGQARDPVGTAFPEDAERERSRSLKPSASSSTINPEVPSCRFCFEGPAFGALISPCACSGTQAHVHIKCLRRWQRTTRSADGGRTCQVCCRMFLAPPLSFYERSARACLLYTSPSPRDVEESRMPSSA